MKVTYSIPSKPDRFDRLHSAGRIIVVFGVVAGGGIEPEQIVWSIFQDISDNLAGTRITKLTLLTRNESLFSRAGQDFLITWVKL